jgi:hypothetical protein
VGKIKLHAFLTLPLDGEAHSTESGHLHFEEKSLDTAGNRTPVVEVTTTRIMSAYYFISPPVTNFSDQNTSENLTVAQLVKKNPSLFKVPEDSLR